MFRRAGRRFGRTVLRRTRCAPRDAQEAQSLRLQFATLAAADKGSEDGKAGRGRYSKYLPRAFTEHGAIMAATLLNSPRATEISVHVVRAFVQWRSMLATNRELSQKLHTLERKVSQHDGSIGELIEAMRHLLAAPEVHKRPIGFVHPQEASKPKPKALKASAAKKAAIAAPTKTVRKK
jgi:hypothetical protein